MRDDSPETPPQRKRLGQVFLRNPRAVSAVVASLQLGSDDVVLEIGGGDGALSAAIAPLAGRLIVVELDERFANLLRRRFAGAGNVVVIQGDILDEATFAQARASEPQRRLVVYGSLPYYIASPILRWTVGRGGDLERASFLIQREVALRAVAPHGSRRYGFLSVLLQRRAGLSLGPVVGRRAFRPVPKVDSQVLHLLPRPIADPAREKRFEEFASALFQRRRKQLGTSLRAMLGAELPQRLAESAARAGFSLRDRPERLSPDQLEALFKAFEE